MRLANNILENYYRVANGVEPWGQLSGMKKLLAKYRELLLYILFGGLTTLINIAVYGTCTQLMHSHSLSRCRLTLYIILYIV